ncbi:hypothetical protein J2855_000092 [Agrobacterium tumefaciens]|uniref:Uncharacterized protein n=1 Tax=Agrobacterium tumefaciens TaxID=358 RepID=A0AAP9E3B5_AGRTU|nr:hypothetical protein [Agrobacterium tumefaciens]MBP2506486.1 hypothetical protein [Agrobacterium tumefaciens]MBP2517112.1 hypothetical protein [Agrobacterium tumefaciens]MBP2575746.1 hypothetical protein [Agrobacterium tumefaciens]MBP2592628.1 hypothetical protein [Agrobacterium tumefaciens]NSY01380.1 hypothetical protein [Agrobacterium tumefaciens]
MRETGFRNGKTKPRISGVRHNGDTAVFPCFSAVVKEGFSPKKTALGGAVFLSDFLMAAGNQPRDPLAIGS